MAPLCVANTLGVLKRPAAIAALKTLPVRFLHSLQYRRLPSATWACDPIFAFGTNRPAVCTVKSGSLSQYSPVKSVSQLG